MIRPLCRWSRPSSRAGRPGRSIASTWSLASKALALALLGLGGSAHADRSELPQAVGHSYGEHETPRMLALGGPMRGSSNSLSALYSNPANMAVAQVYHLGAFAQIHPEARRQSYGGAIVDSLISSTGLSGGLGGIWTLQDPDGLDRQWMDLRFALALPLGDIFFLGVGARYLTLQQNGTGPLGRSEVSGGLQDSNILQTVTFDAGVTLRPVPEFSIALTGNNLTNLDTALFPIMGGLGLGFSTEDFSLNADATLESRSDEQTNVRVSGGGELLLADRIMLRAGYRFDQGLDSHAVSGGLGYVDQRFSIDLSGRRGVAGPAYTAIVFGFTAHIEAMGLGPSSPNVY